jgi:hypothetical protein
VVCKRTDSPTMDCPDVCLEALYCKNGSECWKIATRGPVGRILLELVFRDRVGRTCTCVPRVSDCV